MKSFVHKSGNFIVYALFDRKLMEFVDEFKSNGIRLAFSEDESGRCMLDILEHSNP